MAELRLEPMTEADVREFIVDHLDEYTGQIELHGGWTHEDARAKAENDMAKSFPGGKVKPGHHLFHLVDEATGDRVGILWYREDKRGVWLNQITIDPERRGQGFGRKAMAILESQARQLGASRIELNVFGGNEAARSLYRSLGYREDAVVMSKPVPPPERPVD